MMRLDKLLAHAGYGTRKEVKALIKAKQGNGQRHYVPLMP